MNASKPKILFMCVANSARSQLAEGLAKKHLRDSALVESAGSQPKHVNPLAKVVLDEVGVDTAKLFSKSIDQLSPEFLNSLDFVITLCAEEVCPVLPSKTAKRLNWPLPDPAAVHGSELEKLEAFRKTRDALTGKIKVLGENLGILF